MVIVFLILLKNPSLHHPRATFLGLTNEKIVLLSANSIRATVATENNKVQNTGHCLRNISRLNSWFSSSPCPFSIFSFSVFLTRSTSTKHLKPKRVISCIIFCCWFVPILYYPFWGEFCPLREGNNIQDRADKRGATEKLKRWTGKVWGVIPRVISLTFELLNSFENCWGRCLVLINFLEMASNIQ